MNPAIRLALEQDAESILAIYKPFCVSTAVSFETDPPSIEEMARRIRSTLQRFPWLVVDHGEKVLGYAYAGPHRERAAYRWSVEATAYVSQSQRRMGIGRALYTSLFHILKLQGFYNAYAGITLPNPASVGLHESVGFRPVGVYRNVGYKLGAWHDVGWWQLTIQGHCDRPDAPKDLPEVVKHPDWTQSLKAGLPLLRI
ncbi:MAG: arsinothricin resistance N-acetyltransferase ArsN1 family B [Gemmataceae bacterium]